MAFLENNAQSDICQDICHKDVSQRGMPKGDLSKVSLPVGQIIAVTGNEASGKDNCHNYSCHLPE